MVAGLITIQIYLLDYAFDCIRLKRPTICHMDLPRESKLEVLVEKESILIEGFSDYNTVTGIFPGYNEIDLVQKLAKRRAHYW
jgi:hypothetical protein